MYVSHDLSHSARGFLQVESTIFDGKTVLPKYSASSFEEKVCLSDLFFTSLDLDVDDFSSIPFSHRRRGVPFFLPVNTSVYGDV